MIIGIDVGGTNTDAVLLKDFKVLNKVKVQTKTDNLLDCILKALEAVLEGNRQEQIKRVVLSTTLSTNAIVQDKLDRAGMLVSGGPGINPELFRTGPDYYLIEGSLDHRGREMVEIDMKRVKSVLRTMKEAEISAVGIVSKFSTRAPGHELAIWEKARFAFDSVSLGHKFSGALNFPRRIATTFLNASVSKLYKDFVTSGVKAIRKKGITSPIYILKADGGTMEIENSVAFPVQTIRSGPAASIMGLMALVDAQTYIGLDIGGTTTDISVFYKTAPLFEPYGITIGNHKTLIRGFLTRSIGLGGDSELRVICGNVEVGPQRKGPPMAFGGKDPTLTDALVVLGMIEEGDEEKAFEGINKIATQMGIEFREAAFLALDRSVEIIYQAVTSLLEHINTRPVYTIHELLQGQKILPQLLVVVGGPAKVMASKLQDKFGYPVLLPNNWEVANAIGAALARTTSELTLIADTEMGHLIAVEENFQQKISKNFRLEDLKKVALNLIVARAMRFGGKTSELEFEFIEEQEFNMVRGFHSVGKNIRVKIQVKSGLIGTLREVDIC